MQTPKQKILLTGASGFIGTNFITQLHKKYDITALVRKNSDVSKIEKHCEIYHYDESLDSLKTLFETQKFDGILHLAGYVFNKGHNLQNLDRMLESNIIFGTHILEFAKLFQVDFFINAASFGSYCNSLTYRPASLYASTKKAFEDIMQYYALTSKTIFTNLLIFNTYGPNETKEHTLFFLLNKIAQTNEELAMSNGKQIVDYSHVLDVVNGFDCLIQLIQKEPEFCKDKIFSLKGRERMTLKEMIMLYEKILGKKLNIKWGARPSRELEIMLPWEGGEILPNWKQEISLSEGFKSMLESATMGGGG